MDPPRLHYVLIFLHLKQGGFLISIFGILVAILMILLVSFYSMIEAILINVQKYKPDAIVRTFMMVLILINASMLIVANVLVFVGLLKKKWAAIEVSGHILLTMVTVDIFIVAIEPIACFFINSACAFIKRASYTVQALMLVCMMLHMDIWTYFMLCFYSAAVHSKMGSLDS